MTNRRAPPSPNRRVRESEAKGARTVSRDVAARKGRAQFTETDTTLESDPESDPFAADEDEAEGEPSVARFGGATETTRQKSNVRVSANDGSVVARSRSRSGRIVAVLRFVGAAILLSGVTSLTVFGAYRYARTSPRFAVRNIEVDGLRRLTREAVLARAEVRSGLNVFSVDTDRVSRRLFSDHWIQSATVERRLPATIRITIVEREAFALALMGDTLLLLTKTGEPFKRLEGSDPADLPVITGASLGEHGREPAVEKRRIATALEVLRHYERSSLSRNYVAQEVHLTPGGEVVLMVGKQAIALHLGVGPWARKLAMAERVLGKLHERKGMPSMVFLDNRAHPERVVVRMR